MRLLHTRTLHLEPFRDPKTRPRYAVLSHTWEPGHPSYSDLATDPEHALGSGAEFVRRACHAAEQLGCKYIWVECVCVDRSSSEEVSEAVSSSFLWLQEAAACLVYLADLPPGTPDDGTTWKRCRWWTRAWTLPELLAPSTVRFYDGDWNFRGTKTSAHLTGIISRTTHISGRVLRDASLIPEISVAKRISWAAKRQVRRVEDRAYSLLGILGVHMEATYGEGPASFLRLQEEMLRNTRDMSLLAWESQPDDNDKRPFRGLLASSPAEFSRFIDCPQQWTRPLSFQGDIQSSNKGLSIRTPFISYPGQGQRVLFLDIGAHRILEKKTVLVLFQHEDYYVRAASNPSVISIESGTSITRRISAARDLDTLTSGAINDALKTKHLANDRLMFPPAEEIAESIPAAGHPFGGPASAVVSTHHHGKRSIEESSDTYVLSRASTAISMYRAAGLAMGGPAVATVPAHHHRKRSVAESSDTHVQSRASTSLSTSHMLNSGPKRFFPDYIAPDREDKRLKTRTNSSASQSGSDTMELLGKHSSAASESSSQEGLSEPECASGPPPILDKDHPFLSTVEELTVEARGEFQSWQKTAAPQSRDYLACPFQARNGVRHAACLKRAALRSAQDVKVHIWREHRLPHYCPVCYAVFATPPMKNAHIIQRNCELRLRAPTFEGISEDKRARLAKKDDFSSREDQWRSIWTILFPDETPSSPFPEGEDGRLISLAREFWDQRGRLIVSDFLRKRGLLEYNVKDEERGLAAMYCHVLDRLVDRIFEDEVWVDIDPGAIPAAVPPSGSLVGGLLPGISVSTLGAAPMPHEFPFRGTESRSGSRPPTPQEALVPTIPAERQDFIRSVHVYDALEKDIALSGAQCP